MTLGIPLGPATHVAPSSAVWNTPTSVPTKIVPVVPTNTAAFAGACIDVSDGLLQDLRHLCAASGVGAVVECSRLPLGSAARALPDGMELALSGGDQWP